MTRDVTTRMTCDGYNMNDMRWLQHEWHAMVTTRMTRDGYNMNDTRWLQQE